MPHFNKRLVPILTTIVILLTIGISACQPNAEEPVHETASPVTTSQPFTTQTDLPTASYISGYSMIYVTGKRTGRNI